MFKITLTVTEQSEVDSILQALQDAEEECVINFPFQTQVDELSPEEVSEWKAETWDRINTIRKNY